MWRPVWWPSWVGIGLLYVLGRMPAPVLAALGDLVGLLLHSLVPGRRAVAQRNVDACFPELPERQRQRLVRRHFRHLGRSLFDTGIFWWASARRLRRLVRIQGGAPYQELRQQGRPIILLVPHLLAVQAGLALALEAPIANYYRSPDNPVFAYMYARRMSRFGAALLPRSAGIRVTLRVLQSLRSLYYLPDQDMGREHAVFVPFFGVSAATTTALARLARVSGAAVVPCFPRQRGGGRYELLLGEPLRDFPTGNLVADACRMNGEIERAVRLLPEQYLWVHKRFKTRPDPAAPNFYA